MCVCVYVCMYVCACMNAFNVCMYVYDLINYNLIIFLLKKQNLKTQKIDWNLIRYIVSNLMFIVPQPCKWKSFQWFQVCHFYLIIR